MYNTSATRRYTANLIARIRLNPEQYLLPLNPASFVETFRYADTPFWWRYIIDLEDPAEDCLLPTHPLYLHTPRIFLLHGDTTTYYLERLNSRILNKSRDFSAEIQQAEEHCKANRILAYCEAPRSDVCIIEETDHIKVRFRRFQPDE